MADTELLTSRELAEEFRVHRATILRWAREGRLPTVKLPGRAVRFRRSDVQAIFDTADVPLAVPPVEQVS